MPPPADRMVDFLLNELPSLAAERLNAMAAFPGAKALMDVWDPKHADDTTWWFEGTIRAVVFAQIYAWAATRGKGEYLVLAEQPYPHPFKAKRVDVAIVNRGGVWIFVEIKADFNIMTVPKDAQKLQDARLELKQRYMWGFAFYSLYNDAKAIARWQKEFAAHLDDFGSSAPIIRQ